MRKITENSDFGLVGKFFHCFTEKGLINWQGRFIRKLEGDRYLVIFFSWLTGQPTRESEVSKSEIEGWAVYGSEKEWKDAYRKENEKIAAYLKGERKSLL